MKAASTLHLLALGACLVVQSRALEFSWMPGVRRALQTMETRAEPLSQRRELRFPDVTAAGRSIPWYCPPPILGSIDYSGAFHIAFSMWFIADIASGKNEEHATRMMRRADGDYRAASVCARVMEIRLFAESEPFDRSV